MSFSEVIRLGNQALDEGVHKRSDLAVGSGFVEDDLEYDNPFGLPSEAKLDDEDGKFNK